VHTRGRMGRPADRGGDPADAKYGCRCAGPDRCGWGGGPGRL